MDYVFGVTGGNFNKIYHTVCVFVLLSFTFVRFVFYLHAENTCMSASFHKEGMLRAHKTSVMPPLFYLGACTKPE
jgi:hypothetical protein